MICRTITIFFVNVLFFTKVTAQHYKMAVGLRVGDSYGLSVQGKLFGNTSIEAILHPGLGEQYNNASILIKQHQSIISDRLNIYGGAGPMQSWKNGEYETNTSIKTGGIRAILGAELTIGRYNISWDFAPGLYLWGNKGGSFTGGSAFSLRYVLFKRAKKKIKLNWLG